MKEKTCNEFIQEMKAAGFEFTYRATNGKQVFTGTVTQDKKAVIVKIPTSNESRQKIKELFKKGN